MVTVERKDMMTKSERIRLSSETILTDVSAADYDILESSSENVLEELTRSILAVDYPHE